MRARVRVRDGEGDGEEQHHNMHKRACCGVVPRRRHHVPWGCREWITVGGGGRAKGEGLEGADAGTDGEVVRVSETPRMRLRG